MPKIPPYTNFLVFLAVIITSFYGIRLPFDHINERHVKQYVIQTYKYGITINNDNKLFYNLAPINFHISTAQGNSEVIAEVNSLTTEESKITNKFLLILQNIKSSLKINTIKATLKNKGDLFVLEGKVVNDTLTVSSTTSTIIKGSLVQTLTFNKEDIVFNTNGEVYSEQTDEQIEDINHLYGLSLSSEPKEEIISGHSLYITNLSNPGIIELNLLNKTALVDNKLRSIMINSPNNNDITLKFYNSFGDL